MKNNKNIEILCIIPARGGSKGIHKKNLVKLCGKSLIEYTIDEAKKSNLITRTILSSDDDEIISFCRNKNIEILFKRPVKLAEDQSSMLSVIEHAVKYLKDNENYKPDIILLLQPTSPLRSYHNIDEALTKLIDSNADSIVSVIEVPHNYNPYSIMKLKKDYLIPYLKYDERKNIRQLKPIFYARNGAAIYAFTYNCLINKKSIFGDKILPYFMKKEDSIDIDDEIDLVLAEALLKKNSK